LIIENLLGLYSPKKMSGDL